VKQGVSALSYSGLRETWRVVDARSGYEPILNEALALYSSNILGGQRFREGWRGVGHLAHGWYLRCHRGALAVVLLGDAGFAEEASPLRRSVIEHVVALQWLAVEGDGILDTVARAHADNSQRVRDAVESARWTSISLEEADEAIASAAADERDPANDYLQKFAGRARRYSDAHTMVEYLVECGRSHPSYESAICYYDISDGTFLDESIAALGQVPFGATHVLEALEAVREAFDRRPWTLELRRLIEQFREVTDAVRMQDGLPPAEWPPLREL
jgi:hypothetical protein